MSGDRGAFLLGLVAGGAVRFDRWMDAALYHREFGYYSRAVRDIGRRGDFSTWPRRDASLGRAIARWLRAGRSRLPVIEAGAGTGELAREVVRGLGIFRRRRFLIAEISPALRALQQNLLGSRAEWFDGLGAALEAAGGGADIYANELADAFPCRVFRRESGSWSELMIGIAGGRPVEIWEPARGLPDSSALEADWPDGQRVEVHESLHQWMAALPWRGGRLLLVDYGGECGGVYGRRPGGTLRAYSHHQLIDGPGLLMGFGRRDLTADVNFTDLVRWGRKLGWKTQGARPLDAFLADWHLTVPPALREAAGAFQAVEFGK